MRGYNEGFQWAVLNGGFQWAVLMRGFNGGL